MHGRHMWTYGAHTGPLQSLHGLFMGCLWSLNLYGARKLIIHALKLYRSHKGRHNSFSRAPWVEELFLFKTARGTACMRPGGVMWLGHKVSLVISCSSPNITWHFTNIDDFLLRTLISLFNSSPPLDKMAAISQIFWDAFSWVKRFVFWLNFHWGLFLRVQFTITQHWLR